MSCPAVNRQVLFTKPEGNNGGMKHQEPPDNLPILDEVADTEPTGREDALFRDPTAGDTVYSGQQTDETLDDTGAVSPSRRSLQPKPNDMTNTAIGAAAPIACEGLLDVREVARWLDVGRATVYRHVASGRLATYRLPGGLRFSVDDILALLASCRQEARDVAYGDSED